MLFRSSGAFVAGGQVLRSGQASGPAPALAALSQRASATGTALPQRELLQISGQWAVGDTLTLSGVADADVAYTLTEEDFTARMNQIKSAATALIAIGIAT